MESKELSIRPLPGFALIELEKKYGGLSVDKEKFGTNSSGILRNMTAVSMDSNVFDFIIAEAQGKTVYFTPYEDGDVVEHEGKNYVFVKIEHLRGVKNV